MLVAYLDENFSLLAKLLRLLLGKVEKKQPKQIFVTKTDSFTGFKWVRFNIIGGQLLLVRFLLNCFRGFVN